MPRIKKKTNKRVAVVTGGGDCPGLNAAIRAIVKRGHQLGYEIIGIKDGWKGIVGKIDARELTEEEVRGILTKGGTILGSSRTNPLKIVGGMDQLAKNFKKLQLDGLVAIGGDDTLGIAQKLSKTFPLIAIPKTIDNDVKGTDFCIGFWTAVQTATEALDRLHSTAESHHRVMVMEVMGRHYGWIATYAGMAGGADYILVPEVPIDIDKVCKTVKERTKKGKRFSLVVVSEGARIKGKVFSKIGSSDHFGHKQLGGIGDRVAELIRERIDVETRSVNLGHVLRGGTPVAYDRILGTRLGIQAVESAAKGRYGKAAVLKGDKISLIPISKIRGEKKVNLEVFKAARYFFH